MAPEFRGEMRGQGLRVGVIVSRFNEFITSRLLYGAREALRNHGVREDDITIGVAGDGGLGIGVDRENPFGPHRADPMLNRPRDPNRQIELRRYSLSGTAHLPIHRQPSSVADRT